MQPDEGLTVRSGPSIENKDIKSLKKGTKVICKTLNDTGDWMQITDGGWVCIYRDREILIGLGIPISPKDVVGIWESENRDGYSLDVRKNGTYTYGLDDEIKDEGKWRIKGSWFYISIDGTEVALRFYNDNKNSLSQMPGLTFTLID